MSRRYLQPPRVPTKVAPAMAANPERNGRVMAAQREPSCLKLILGTKRQLHRNQLPPRHGGASVQGLAGGLQRQCVNIFERD